MKSIFRGAYLTDKTFESLAHFHDLRKLVIRGPQKYGINPTKIGSFVSPPFRNDSRRSFTRAGLLRLAELRNVEVLEISNLGIADDDLEVLTSLGSLKKLNLNYTDITDSGLKYLRQLDGLVELELGGTSISELGIRDSLPTFIICDARIARRVYRIDVNQERKR